MNSNPLVERLEEIYSSMTATFSQFSDDPLGRSSKNFVAGALSSIEAAISNEKSRSIDVDELAVNDIDNTNNVVIVESVSVDNPNDNAIVDSTSSEEIV